jgi:hypothetical protein
VDENAKRGKLEKATVKFLLEPGIEISIDAEDSIVRRREPLQEGRPTSQFATA